MKNLLLLLAVHCVAHSFAQEKEYDPTAKSLSKFSLGTVFSPGVSYRFLSSTSEADATTLNFVDWRNEKEEYKYAQSARFFMNYKLSELFSLEAGLGYTEYGDLRISTSPPVEGGAPNESSGSTTKWTKHLHTLSVPINLNINLEKKRVTSFFSMGCAPSYLLKSVDKRKTEYNNGNTNSYTYAEEWSFEKYTNFFLEAHISAGIEYQYSPKGRLRIAPEFKILTTNVYTNEGMRGNYFNIGINVGLILTD